jgi:hypothetical protein
MKAFILLFISSLALSLHAAADTTQRTNPQPQEATKAITPDNVYFALMQLNSYLDQLLKNSGLVSWQNLYQITTTEKVTPKDVYSVLQAASQILRHYQLRFGLAPIANITYQDKARTPTDTQRLATLLLVNMEQVLEHKKIIPDKLENQASVTGKKPKDVFQLALASIIKMAELENQSS